MGKAFWDAYQVPGPFDTDVDEEPFEDEPLARDEPRPGEEWDDDLGDEPPEPVEEDDDADLG